MADNENGGVIIALENPLLDSETLENTPSRKDGLDKDTEAGLRWHGCKLIQYSCLLLKLPAATLVTGQILFHRYFYSKSLVRCKLDVASLACIWLASKVEESPRRLRNVTNVLLRIRQLRRREEPKPILVDDEYYQTKKELINMERKILKDLGFCVHVNHPYKYLFYISNWLQQTSNREFLQGAWNYMNDSLMTNLYVRYHPKIIICACLHLSARILGIPLPREPAWFEIFGVGTEEIEQICFTILELYTSEPPNLDVLEAKCKLARKIVDEKRAEERKVLAEKYKYLKAAETPETVSEPKSVTPEAARKEESPQRPVEEPIVIKLEKEESDKEQKAKSDSNHDKRKRDERRSDDDRSERRRHRDEDYENHSRNRRHSRSRSPSRKERRDPDRERHKSSRYYEDSRRRKYDDSPRRKYDDSPRRKYDDSPRRRYDDYRSRKYDDYRRRSRGD